MSDVAFVAAPGADAEEVLAGLAATPKRLPTKLLYDERGSQLFEAITRLPEYYLTRAELAILAEMGEALGRHLGDAEVVVELGSGSGRKTHRLLRLLPRVHTYVAVDISAAALRQALGTLRPAFPRHRLYGVVGDYLESVPLPPALAGLRPLVVFFGSTIGNLEPPQVRRFLRAWAERLGPTAAFLVGVDRKKEAARLSLAYNDAQGVTAAFNRNLLRRLNRELGATFDLAAFRHHAPYHVEAGRIEMYLISMRRQRVRIADREIALAAGEPILTEYSYKYAVEEFLALAGDAGLNAEAVWSDAQRQFCLYLLRPAAGS
jgi:L-histidine N-alpha-methyltransferase